MGGLAPAACLLPPGGAGVSSPWRWFGGWWLFLRLWRFRYAGDTLPGPSRHLDTSSTGCTYSRTTRGSHTALAGSRAEHQPPVRNVVPLSTFDRRTGAVEYHLRFAALAGVNMPALYIPGLHPTVPAVTVLIAVGCSSSYCRRRISVTFCDHSISGNISHL